jgi:hypothetical protein
MTAGNPSKQVLEMADRGKAVICGLKAVICADMITRTGVIDIACRAATDYTRAQLATKDRPCPFS